MYFPDVPDVLGVPIVPRLSSTVIGSVSRNISAAATLMNHVALSALANPEAELSTISLSVNDANLLIGGVAGTLTNYPSALFNRFTSPVGMIQSSLGSLITTINMSPTDPVSSAADLITISDIQLDSTSADFEAATDEITGEPALDDGVETVTSTAIRSNLSWGIVDKQGQPVIQGDNFISIEYKKDYIISDYPIEEGGFSSYNKVSMPFDARLAVSCGGSLNRRADFLDSIKKIEGDLNLYDVVMPEDAFTDVNIQHVDFKRTSSEGLGLITVYIYVLEIRTSVESSFSQVDSTPASPTKTKAPAGAATHNNGTVQTKPTTAVQKQLLDDPIPGVGVL